MKIDRIRTMAVDVALAFVLLTRLPMPRLPEAAFERSARAVWAYPLTGLAVGGLGCLAGMAALAVDLPVVLAAALSLALMMLATGAMHEDGLADVADGFWGGNDPERRLAIMKDSQIGTYGTLALIMVSGARWSALVLLLPTLPLSIIAAAILSRAAMPLLMAGLDPARTTGLSQSVGRPETTVVACSCALSVGCATIFLGGTGVVSAVLALAVAACVAGLAQRKLRGQTGDVLGATQQLCECVILGYCASLVT